MALDASLLDVVDLAYQAAVDPVLWPQVLEGVIAATHGDGAMLLHTDRLASGDYRRACAASCGFDVAELDAYLNRFQQINPIQAAMDEDHRRGRAPDPVATDQTWVPKDELVASEFYNTYMRSAGIHGVLMIRLGDSYAAPNVNIMRKPGRGEFDRLEMEVAQALQGPLSRAYQLSRRVRAERQVEAGLAEFAERAAGALILADADGRIRHANRAAEALLAKADGLTAAQGRLKAATPEASRTLIQLIDRAAGEDQGPDAAGGMSAPRPSGARPLALSVAPVSAEGEWPASRERLALILAVDPDEPVDAAPDLLRQLFGLTGAEAKVVAELAAGHEPKAVAERLGLSLNTVCVLIARAKAKTDTSRQADLVSLVVRIAQS
jgi:DNA-binding CsgD family transcriptional regulator